MQTSQKNSIIFLSLSKAQKKTSTDFRGESVKFFQTNLTASRLSRFCTSPFWVFSSDCASFTNLGISAFKGESCCPLIVSLHFHSCNSRNPVSKGKCTFFSLAWQTFVAGSFGWVDGGVELYGSPETCHFATLQLAESTGIIVFPYLQCLALPCVVVTTGNLQNSVGVDKQLMMAFDVTPVARAPSTSKLTLSHWASSEMISSSNPLTMVIYAFGAT